MTRGRKKRHRPVSNEGRPIYSEGQLNMLIDVILHPLKKTHWVFILVDEALHMINEGDIEQSAYKFVQFSLPELLRKFLKKNKS